ncbi:hypothetical protein DXG01_013414 [Tephrocybe rancida]|nr:hypothetical protein DXG01_013414 [Tephrocybe rancida]
MSSINSDFCALSLSDVTTTRSPLLATSSPTTLPVELWLEILSHMPTSSIQAMTYTCSSLRWLAQPLLFKLFIIRLDSPHAQNSSGRRDIHPASGLVRLAALQLAHIANAMTEIRLVPSVFMDRHEQGTLSPQTTKSLLVDTLFSALPSLSNLRKFICHDVLFTKYHLSILSRIPNLKHLEVQSCRTICLPEDFPSFESTSLETLVVDYPFNSRALFRNSRFLALLLQARKLSRIFAGPGDEILFAMTETPPPPTLSILEIPVSCVLSPLFDSVLASCSSVQELSLYMATGDSYLPPLEHLPEGILPNLRSYHGPRTYAPWFTRDRSIRDVDFPLPALPNDLCNTIGHMTREIESLSCKVDSLDATLLQTIHTTFPSLKHLAISGAAVDIDRLSSVLSIAKVHKGLTSIQITVQTGVPRLTDSWGATVAKMVLSRLIRAYPILEHAKLVYQPQVSVVWSRSKERKQTTTNVDASELRIEKQEVSSKTSAIWDMFRFNS